MINLIPDLIKKTAAHKLVWRESQNFLCDGRGTYYSKIADSFLLRLSVDYKDKELTIKITKLNAGNYDGTVGILCSSDPTLKSKDKKSLRRLYRMAELLSPTNAGSGTPKLTERFHRILRAL